MCVCVCVSYIESYFYNGGFRKSLNLLNKIDKAMYLDI